MLYIEHLTKSYGDTVVLDDYSLHVERGALCCIVGENGIGKTTLIKCCCGLSYFQKGQIRIDGISIKDDLTAYKKKLAYIPDNPDIYEYMTGYEYLNFVCDIYRVSDKDRKREFDKYCDKLNIQKYLPKKIQTYSHGTRQKLVILSSLMHKPSMIFMDEPLVGLDEETVFRLKTMMKDYCSHGGSILCSTHLYDKVSDVCDRKVTFS
ncbi:MAG: ABC transporter ATP-binding protein [Lachnospira sp.]|nr:ABC transporter ATP-binding protein [Lachnospira sp.]